MADLERRGARDQIAKAGDVEGRSDAECKRDDEHIPAEQHGARPYPSRPAGAGIFSRKASSAARARATPTPPTQADHPTRSKS